ncbi:peroxisomal membrane protein 11C-like [Clavelina lepadiformis]|uniref:Peroxisomal membrane protein 11C n=1 Tax=Clavelina lepadiformis TaxID=159417 RepID=A0ABP0GWZ1_CLALP
MSSPIIPVVTFLESYRGRDKIMRTASFAACLGSGLTSNSNKELSDKLLKVMGELSACRTILRLFDDLSMLAVTLGYGTGKKETDLIQRTLSVASNVVNQAFFPIEHIAWAAEKELISTTAAPWWLASLLAWIVSLTINITKCLRNMVKAQMKMMKLSSKRSNVEPFPSESIKDLRKQRNKECLSVIESVSNLGMAVHWLPGGYLWSGKLNNTAVGTLGVIASVIGLLKMTVYK